MSKRKRKVVAKLTSVEEPKHTGGPIIDVVPAGFEQTPVTNEKTDALKTIVAELEADPLVPMSPEFPREYGEKIYPRYQKLMAQLKALAE